MRYCTRCITPDTRPHITFDADGVCNACLVAAQKRVIDWARRAQAFGEVARHAKASSRGYDCIVPVSGGKDSTWQVVTCLEQGLNPLAVTWRPPGRTAVGQRNLDNLMRLGVDHIDYQISPRTEKKFTYRALVDYGTPAIPMHMAIFNIPLKIAVKFDVPLVVWGENSAFEYGGTEEERTGFKLDSTWLRKFGVMHGTTARDWVSADLTARELTPYFGPTDEELERQGVLAVFLGYYFPWDVETSLRVAIAHGFEVRAEGPKTGYYNYADIDDDFVSVHHYLKWYKFGFTRLFDNLSLEIRAGRLTRDQAIRIVRETGDRTPHADIETLCAFLGITKGHFFDTIEKFRNRDIWNRREGAWTIDGFLIPDWNWT